MRIATHNPQPWAEVWADATQNLSREAPRVMVPGPHRGSAYACAGCPGADQSGCCRHGEYILSRRHAIRQELETVATITGTRGRRRRWRIAELFARRVREEHLT